MPPHPPGGRGGVVQLRVGRFQNLQPPQQRVILRVGNGVGVLVLIAAAVFLQFLPQAEKFVSFVHVKIPQLRISYFSRGSSHWSLLSKYI